MRFQTRIFVGTVVLFCFSVNWRIPSFELDCANGGIHYAKKRYNYTVQEKITILKRHLLDKIQVSDMCDEYHPRHDTACPNDSLKGRVFNSMSTLYFVTNGSHILQEISQ